MKKMKRLLSIMLVYALLVSSLAIGTSAYDSYTEPAGFDSIGDPYYSYGQSCSMLMDFLDQVLYKANINQELNLVVKKFQLDLTSLDKAFDSLSELLGSTLFTIAKPLIGDVADLKWSMIESPRRRNGTPDADMLYVLTDFLGENRSILRDIINTSFDWGIIDDVASLPAMLMDLPGYLKDQVYFLCYDQYDLNADGDKILPAGVTRSSFTIDQCIQYLIDKYLIGTYDITEQKYSGFLPSLRTEGADLGANAKTNVSTNSFYDLVQNIIDAAMVDVVIPLAMDKLPDLLNMETSEEFPYGDPANPGYFPTVVGVVRDMLHLDYTYNAEEYPIIEMENFLNWFLLSDEGLGALVWISDDGVKFNEEFYNGLLPLLKTFGPLLSGFGIDVLEGISFPPQAEIDAMTKEEFFSMMLKTLLPNFIESVEIPDDAVTIRGCVTYLLISLSLDILPEKDYYGMIAAGTLDPNTTEGVLAVGAPIAIYYLNSLFAANIPANASFEGMLDALLNYLINNYGFILNTSQNNFASMNPWEKADNTIFKIADNSWINVHPTAEHPTTSYALIIDTILEGILELNPIKLLSFISKSDDPAAEFNKPALQVVLNLLSRIFKSLMQGNDVVAPGLTTLEAFCNATNLGTLIYNFAYQLQQQDTAIFPTLIPLVGQLIGLKNNDGYKVYPPTGYAAKTIQDVENLMEACVPSNTGVLYNTIQYKFFGPEDFAHLYQYNNFNKVYKSSQELVEQYKTNSAMVNATDIKNQYYSLDYYYNLMQKKSALCVTQLQREVNEAVTAAYVEADYSLRSWNVLQRALSFAQLTLNRASMPYYASQMSQSTISEARYQLFLAQKFLKPACALASYYALDFLISTLETVNTEEYLTKCTSDSVAAYRVALNAAKSLDRDYGVDEQEIVDSMFGRLDAASAALSLWGINYELQADLQLNEIIPKGSVGVLKFREASGAAIDNIRATASGGATLSENYYMTTENVVVGDTTVTRNYYCWDVNTSAALTNSAITCTVSFTQPSTGKAYSAKTYAYITTGEQEIAINGNNTVSGKLQNLYTLSINGLDSVSSATVNYTTTQAANGAAAILSDGLLPTGYLYVDVGKYDNLNQIPGFNVTLTKTAESYAASYAGGGMAVFTSVNSGPFTNTAPASYEWTTSLGADTSSLEISQHASKTHTFSGNLPAAGSEVSGIFSFPVSAESSSGGAVSATPRFKITVRTYDKTALRTAVNDAIEACRQSWFYASGFDIYMADLARAKNVLNMPGTNQAAIDEATQNLLNSISWLEYKSADYKTLNVVMAKANSLDPLAYENFGIVEAALAAIQKVDVLQQSQVNAYVESLNAAIAELIPVKVTCIINCYDTSGAPIATESSGTDFELVCNDSTVLINSSQWIGNVGSKVIVNVPEIVGYTSTDSAQNITLSVEGNTVNFYYTPNNYTVALNPKGGVVSETSVSVTYGKTYADLPTPTRTNYNFVGWYTKLSGGIRVDENTPVTSSYYRTLYAHWEIVQNAAENGAVSPEIQSIDKVQSIFDRIVSAMVDIFNVLFSRVFGFIGA